MERHQHPGHQLIYVSTGVLVAQTAAGSWVASRDRAIWMPAETWHEHRAYGAALIHTVGFDVDGPPLAPDAPAIVAVTGLLRELLLALTDAVTPPPEADRLRAVLRDRLRRTTRNRSHCRRRTIRGSRTPARSPLSIWKRPCHCQHWPTPRTRQNGPCRGSSAQRPA